MAPKAKFEKVADSILSIVADQVMKLLQQGSQVDMYFSLKKLLVEAQQFAYEEGYRVAKQEIMDKVIEFDQSQDPTSN